MDLDKLYKICVLMDMVDEIKHNDAKFLRSVKRWKYRIPKRASTLIKRAIFVVSYSVQREVKLQHLKMVMWQPIHNDFASGGIIMEPNFKKEQI